MCQVLTQAAHKALASRYQALCGRYKNSPLYDRDDAIELHTQTISVLEHRQLLQKVDNLERKLDILLSKLLQS